MKSLSGEITRVTWALQHPFMALLLGTLAATGRSCFRGSLAVLPSLASGTTEPTSRNRLVAADAFPGLFLGTI